jgi:pyrroline-5-carboxylate reductase
MKNQNKKIAFVGNGKLTKAFVKGFLHGGVSSDEILVVGRENSDLSEFQNLGVKTSRNIASITDYHLIMLTVTPKGIVEQLERMKTVFNGIHPQKNPDSYFGVYPLVLSMSSGTNIQKFSKILDLHPGCILKGTTNTNVEYGKGIIRIAGIHNGVNMGKFDSLFKVSRIFNDWLSVTYLVSSKEVDRSITTVGSMNAVDARALEIMIRNEIDANATVTKERLLVEFDIMKIALLNTDQYDELNYSVFKHYIRNKREVLEMLGYTKDKAKILADVTMRSTLESLMEVENFSENSFGEFIQKVATKGGCTERGINNMNSIEDLTNKDRLWHVIKPIFRKTKKFPKEAFGKK